MQEPGGQEQLTEKEKARLLADRRIKGAHREDDGMPKWLAPEIDDLLRSSKNPPQEKDK